jgi:antitoxin (DNA-binding transcriptional repressor) of toxin-antitoxin stability system
MAIQLEIGDLGPPMSDALEKVRRGEEVTFTDHGKAFAKVVPLEPITAPELREFGFFKGKIWMADDFDATLPDDLFEELEP